MIELNLNSSIIEKHENWIFGDNKNKSNRLYQKLKNHVETVKDEDVKKILKSIFGESKKKLLLEITTLWIKLERISI